jgi:hypothetical protein
MQQRLEGALSCTELAFKCGLDGDIGDADGCTFYGEITRGSLGRLFASMIQKVGTADGGVKTLVDIGSGLGGVCIHWALETGGKAVGIELAEPRTAHAQTCANDWRIQDRVSFSSGDAANAEESSAWWEAHRSVPYFYCFDKVFNPEVCDAIADNLMETDWKVFVTFRREWADYLPTAKLADTISVTMKISGTSHMAYVLTNGDFGDDAEVGEEEEGEED